MNLLCTRSSPLNIFQIFRVGLFSDIRGMLERGGRVKSVEGCPSKRIVTWSNNEQAASKETHRTLIEAPNK